MNISLIYSTWKAIVYFKSSLYIFIDKKSCICKRQPTQFRKRVYKFEKDVHYIEERYHLIFSGNYSRLACEIQFVRSMGYYLIQIYIPSGLIVIISWVSFWLNRNATPARVALGVTTVLTMTTLMSSTNAALPKISYVKSIDVYLGTCFVMVFASLLGKYTKTCSYLISQEDAC